MITATRAGTERYTCYVTITCVASAGKERSQECRDQNRLARSPPTLFTLVQVLTQQQIVMRPRQVPNKFWQGLKRQCTKTAVEPPATTIIRRYHVPVHGTQMLQQVGFLLEHSDAESTGERLFARVYAQVCFQVPGHTELLAAVFAAVFADSAGRGRRGTTLLAGWVRAGVGG